MVHYGHSDLTTQNSACVTGVRRHYGPSSSAASATVDNKPGAHTAEDIRLGELPRQLVRGLSTPYDGKDS